MLDSFSGKLITAIRTHQKNRAYLVTDKAVYTAGESIWFTAFPLNTGSQKLSRKNKFVFVDLVDEKDSVISVAILDAANYRLHSRIILSNELPEGNYWLRAYTWQTAESDANNIFVKPIYVASTNSNNHIAARKKNSAKSDSSLIMTFYPEGGSMITGINSTVAVRITDKTGAPVSTNGYVKDSRDSIAARFVTNASGLAKFEFEPSRLRSYRGVANWNSKEISYPLPLFNFYAGQLAVKKQATGYALRILLEDSIYQRGFATYVVGISRDSLVFASIGRGLYEVAVDKQRLPEGITTFYLFDKSFKVLSERSVYVRDNNIHINAGTDKSLYGRRDKVALNISISDAQQQPIPSLLAISVIDSFTSGASTLCTLPLKSSQNLLPDNLFLATNNCLSDDDIDLVMLLRNSDYQTISKSEYKPKEIDRDSLLFIRGTVLNEKNERFANSVITLFSIAGNPVMYSDTTDNKGRFCFPLENYADSTQFAVEVKTLNGSAQKTTIIYDPVTYPKVNTPVALKQYLPIQAQSVKKFFSSYYTNQSQVVNDHLLANVTVKGRKKVDYDESKRVSPYSAILTSNDLDENTPVGQSLLRVGGVTNRGGRIVIGGPSSFGAIAEPLLIVDGVEVRTPVPFEGDGTVSGIAEYFKGVSPKDIDFIEVLKYAEAANYGLRGGNGAILVNTVSKRKDVNANRSNLTTFYAKGVSNAFLYPMPNYQQKDMNTTVADNRTTLFWSGNLLSDNNNSPLTFYTSDIPATYIATITGITAHGDIIYKTVTFRSR